MKKLLLSTFSFLAITSYTQNVNIVDPNFKAICVNNLGLNSNGDSEIQLSEAQAYTGTIFISNQNVSDLTGLEAFINLNQFFCGNNQISNIDLSSNTALTYIDCSQNNISTLDLSSNTSIQTVKCSDNNISQLNLSVNSQLINLNCASNSLVYLNIQNGNNTNFIASQFDATGNPNLTCITADDVSYANSNFTNIDSQTSFNLNCPPPCYVNIPDTNFKSYLVGNTLINTNGNSEIECSEAVDFTGDITCPNQNIADFTGLEEFVNITGLFCWNNSITNIDLSANVLLEDLVCKNNQLSTLDLSNNSLLLNVQCDNNQISALDMSNNPNVEALECDNNNISTLDVSMLEDLFNFHCSGNNITSIDLSNNPDLETISVYNNNLSVLNLANGNNTNIIGVNAMGNPNLTCIKVDDENYSTSNWTAIDAHASFNENCPTVGIKENNVSLSIYPNPVNDVLNIETDNEIGKIEILDLSGKVISIENQKEINISNFSGGVYFVKVFTVKGIAIQKILKK